MAISSTNKTNALTGVTKYADTIDGLIKRISEAHEIIQAKAIDLALKIKKGEGSNVNGTADIALADSHKIMDTASAINSIVISEPGNLSIGVGGSYTVPVGYVKTAYTVSGPTLSGNATTSLVLEGKTFYSNSGTKLTGAMADLSGNQNAGGKGTYSNNGSYLYLSIPSTGYYTKDSQLKSDIPYNNSGIIDGITKDASNNAIATWNPVVEITKTTNSESNESSLTINSLTIPKGYYTTDIVVKPILASNDAGNKIINTTTYTASGAVSGATPGTGYDYFTAVTVGSAAGSALSDGRYKVTTAGWIAAGTYGTAYGGYGDASTHTLTARSDNKFGTDAAITSGTTSITSKYYTDVVTKGHTDGETKYLVVRDAAGSLSASLSSLAKTYTPSIGKHSNTNVSTSAVTTTKPTSGYYVAVNSAANTGTVTATASNSLTTTGWLGSAFSNATATATVGAAASAVTYIPITAGTHTIGTLTKNGDTAITSGSDTLVAANAYYIKCSTTTGYLTASDTYITITTGSATGSGVSYDSTNGKFTGSVSLSAGYYPALNVSLTDFGINKGAAFTVTRSGYLIAANTYFSAKTTVSVASVGGTLADGSGTSANILTSDTASATSATTKLLNMTGDTTFYATGDGTSKRYFSSFKVEVADTIAALQAI